MTHNITSGTKRSASTFRDAVFNRQFGENGMAELTNTGVGSTLLALNQLVRGGDPKSMVDEILHRANPNEIADLVVLLFATRNARGGKGEKKLAYDMLERFRQTFPMTAARLIHLFPQYGYWKDILLIMADHSSDSNDAFIQAGLNVMKDQLVKDIKSVEQYKQKLRTTFDESELENLRRKGPSVSLLAKWLPREGSSLDKKTGFVGRFVELLMPDLATQNGMSWESKAKAHYRKTIAEMTSYLALPEVLLAAHREEEIQFQRVASKATMRLRKVFLNEDKHGRPRSEDAKRVRLAERFHLHVAKKGLKGGQIDPHEIVKIILNKRNISTAEEKVLDAQWKDLWRGVVKQAEAAATDNAEFNPTRMVPMADVSGSMYGVPMEVSLALSIGLSEITHEAFQDMVMTFSRQPKWHRLNPNDTIVQKVRSLARADWCMNTNFEAAYDLILATAEAAKLKREDLPTLVVFSDMQFDAAAGRQNAMTTMHEHLSKKFKRVGKRLGWTDTDPTPIVYWNLRNTGGHPVDKDTEGAVLLAGFSPSLLKLVLRGEALSEEMIEMVEADGSVVTKKVRVTPEEVLRKLLDDSVYDPVREVLAASSEGALKEYEVVSE